MSIRFTAILFISICISAITPSLNAQTTTLVSIAQDGKLTYKPDAVGSVIPDFSGVGYRNSEHPIPDVPVVKTVTAVAGDNTSNVQTAINQVASMPLQANGFRGAILFKAGLYEIASRINITASGIVLRGEGLTTEFKATGTTQYDLIRIGGGSVSANTAVQKKITDTFVPIGTKSVTVESGHSFVTGEWVYLRREPNNAWITMLGMDQIARSTHPDVKNWVASDYKVNYERQILAVDGNKLYFDAPVMDIIDPLYANGYVSKMSSTRITDVGIENMKMTSAYTTSWPSSETGVNHDESHGWNAIKIENSKDVWVRNVTAYYFGFSCVNIGASASFVTVDGCAMYDPISKIEGGRRYSFNIDGQRSLVQNCTTRNGRHDYVNGARVAGPSVFYKNTATLQRSDMGPHHRWATGILYDNITGNGQLFVQDRDYQGTGHGWAGSQIMLWNCKINRIIIQSPQSHHTNWAIGCTVPIVNDKPNISNVGQWVTRSWGVVESTNNPITAIPGLFVAQLNERLKNLGESPITPEIEFGDENLTPNGDFEIWPNPTSAMPNFWTSFSNTYRNFYFHATDPEQGNVLHLKDTIPSGVTARRFNTTGFVNIASAGVYRITFKVKGNVGLRGVVLLLGTGTPNVTTASAINHVAPITEYPSGTMVDEWTTLQYDISVPADATFSTDYKLHISWSSSLSSKPVCDFYIDDIKLQRSITTAVEMVGVNESMVYASGGQLIFTSNENLPFSVYNISGHKVNEGMTGNSGTATLPRGVYIVKIQNRTQKVIL
jgi:hypothetical protein